jgi:methionyl-tRNA synthetase
MASLRPLFITTALPFSNGPFHIGHIMEYIQADIWVRFQRMQGRPVHFVGADDTHGAPIMLKAEAEGITPEELIRRIGAGRRQYLEGFYLSFDHWYSTHSPENFELSTDIYRKLKAAGLIYVKPVEQFFDPVKQMFLADRYVKGQCPNPTCGALDQYGDNCEVCGTAYSPTDLINPYSTLSGKTPVRKTSDHYFFRLSDPKCIEFMKGWLDTPGRLQPSVANKAREWLSGSGEQALGDWDISRDEPYFGIPIPDAPGKYFYVWLDAPIGYLASLKNYFDSGKARAQGELRSFDEFLAAPDTQQVHIIGKDIIYFHTLFWPAMLKFAGRKVPDHVYVHGFIMLGGAKMSKSRGTGLSPLRYLELGLNPEWLRYYIAAKLNANVEDMEFNPEDFVARVNSDLVGKYVNIASRTAGFISKRFGGQLGSGPFDSPLLDEVRAAANRIAAHYEQREFGKAMREIMEAADLANAYIAQQAPWDLAKDPQNDAKLKQVCTISLNVFRLLTLYLKPVVPKLAESVENFLRIPPLQWQDAQSLLENHVIGSYEHLMTRADPKQLDALLGLDEAAAKPAAKATPPATTQGAGEVTVEDFAKLDLRIAKIVTAETVEGADKLLKLTLDIGDGQRTVFAGIRSAYTPEQLSGRMTLVLANLKPRKMRFGVSEGMVLAAGPIGKDTGGKDIFLLSPDAGATPGMKVK